MQGKRVIGLNRYCSQVYCNGGFAIGYVTQSAAGSWKGLSIKPRNVIINLCDQNLQGIMAIVNVCSLGQSTIDVVSMQPSTLMYIKLLGIFLKAILISGI